MLLLRFERRPSVIHLCFPTTPTVANGAHGRTRTYNIRSLKPTPLPIGPHGHMVSEARIELATRGV